MEESGSGSATTFLPESQVSSDQRQAKGHLRRIMPLPLLFDRMPLRWPLLLRLGRFQLPSRKRDRSVKERIQ